MQVKNQLLFGLLTVLLIGGTVLPAMSQTAPDEETPKININLDSSTYDLNQEITVSGQVLDFQKNTRDPSLDMIEITFRDPSGNIPTSSYSDDGTLCEDGNNCALGGSEQTFTFKIMPDQLGNIHLTTMLSSVMFNYGIYKVEVRIYQSGNITETIELEISPPVEEVVVETQPLVAFETCDFVIRGLQNELKSTECSSNNDFRIGDKIIIKGKVRLSDPTADSQVSIENTNIQKNTIAPKFVKVSIPYAKAMILDTSENFITTTGAAVLNEQKTRLSTMWTTVLPDQDGNFSAYFDLRQMAFKSGLYVVKATYMGEDFESTVRIIDPTLTANSTPEITVATDKTEYSPGETVLISGKIINSYYVDTVKIFIESPDISGYNCAVIECLADNPEQTIIPESGLTEHTFSWDYQLSLSDASIGKYTVNAGSSIGVKSEATFFVIEDATISPITPSESETESETLVPKKIIKKFNRISDSDISITLDDMDSEAEHVPRVIQGSLFTAARGQESDVNIQVSASNGDCVIGQDTSCMINKSTRTQGAIYEIVTIEDQNYKIRYSGTDVRLEKFTILPESSGIQIDIQDWNVQVIKEDQPTRFYYKISYVNLE